MAARQRSRLDGGRLDDLVDFWRAQLAEAPTATDLPVDHPRPSTQRFASTTRLVELSPATTDRLHSVQPGDAIDIPIGAAHRIANVGTDDLELIEVQHGTYFGEDEIVRLDDDHGRLAD